MSAKPPPPTLEQAWQRYRDAKRDLTRDEERWESYDGNNPGKYRAAINNGRIIRDSWRSHLKREHGITDEELDAA